jgi:hypothetical protein
VRSGLLEKVLRKLAKRLQGEGRLNLREAFIDATFAAAKKGGLAVSPTQRGKGTKITAITVGDSVPIAVSVQAASPHESPLVEEAIGNSFLDELPARLIGDKAYDSDGLDQQMQKPYGIERIAAHRGNRKEPTQDGRPLRRYRRLGNSNLQRISRVTKQPRSSEEQPFVHRERRQAEGMPPQSRLAYKKTAPLHSP